MCEFWVVGKGRVVSYIFTQMEFHYQRCPFGTDCLLSRKMMMVSNFELFGDEFEQIQTYCLAWVPVEHIAWVMVIQASLANLKTEIMSLASEVIFCLLSSLAQGLSVSLEMRE